MSTPIPNITGGAATSGDVQSDIGVQFAPVNVGGLFGSGAQSSSDFLMPALIIGGVILAAFILKKK